MVLNLEKLYKYTQFRGRSEYDPFPGLYGKTAKANERILKAKEESKKTKVSVDEIIGHTNDFLKEIGVAEVTHPKVKLAPTQISARSRNVKIDYGSLKNDPILPLNNETHLIWMKFTKDGDLGVVAASNDVNFSYNNTAGIILRSLKKEWNEEFVLIFPLSHISDGLRKDIECGVGNYLSDKGVPILDYYSHRFQ